MKNITKRVVVLTLVVCMFLGMTQIAMASDGTFRTTSRVNMRSEPSTEASVVSVVESGASVEVLAHDPAGWSRVQVGGSSGYIRSDLLSFPVGETPPIFRTTSGVNMRASASTEADVVQTVERGTSVEVLEHNPAEWSRVRVGGATGFIRSDFLTRSEPDTSIGVDVDAADAAQVAPDQAAATLFTTGTVNMRTGASTNYDVVSQLSPNTSVSVVESRPDGWSRVSHNGTDGFIRSDLLSATETALAGTSSNLLTTGTVNMRTGASTDYDVVSQLAPNTSVEILENQSNGWSRVRHGGTDGFIRSDLLSVSGASGVATGPQRTLTGVNFRSSPSTDHSVIRGLVANTRVEVLERRSDGWSRVRHDGDTGYISSQFLGPITNFEMIEWSEARRTIPRGRDLHIVDVRTGISFNVRAFSLGNHADVEPSTQADTEAIRRTRNGIWSWVARPVWVTVGNRTFPAALNGMPHGSDTIQGNGMNGHLCLWFRGSTSHNSTSSSYRHRMLSAVDEAWNARPR